MGAIKVTDKAVGEIRRVMDDQKFSTDEYLLEVGLLAGGCSGFQYKLGFKKKAEIDQLNETVFKFDGLDAVVHNKALAFMDGTTVDFHDGLNKRGFTFENPSATGGCGCGRSFSA